MECAGDGDGRRNGQGSGYGRGKSGSIGNEEGEPADRADNEAGDRRSQLRIGKAPLAPPTHRQTRIEAEASSNVVESILRPAPRHGSASRDRVKERAGDKAATTAEGAQVAPFAIRKVGQSVVGSRIGQPRVVEFVAAYFRAR